MNTSPAWEDNRMCFACGTQNPAGLHLTFIPEGERGLRSEFTPGPIYQGYKDVVHGGIIGLLLDEVMVNLPWLRFQIMVVTAHLELRLHRPAPVGKSLVIRAELDEVQRERLYRLHGEVKLHDGTLIATARAKCVKV